MIRLRLFRLILIGVWLVVPLCSALLVIDPRMHSFGPEFAILLVVLHCMWIGLLLHPDQYLENFWDEYVDDVERLMDTPRAAEKAVDLKSLPLVICGCCREVEAHLPGVLESMHAIGKQFRDYRIVIFENDSRDATRRILVDERHRFPEIVTLLLEDGMPSPKRTERLAYIRNRLLETARSIDPGNEGLLLMMDMDDVAAEGTLAETIHTCFDYPFGSWDALAANRRLVYYDIWALRIRHHIEFDFVERCERFPSPEGQRKYFLRFRSEIRASDRLLPVLSAFGGAGLYKMSGLQGKHYVGLNADGGEICEHLSLHAQMIAEGGRIFINTRMVMA
ncbi:MAG: hypothetical protein CFE26_03735 [Verrucomicrobiales bacterium VVV1]|nr:MAG: hypothetical protein CFE26_03735 [Verrucomicrobiales bacterium VVV1]